MTASEVACTSGSAIQKPSWVGIVEDDASLRLALARVLRGNGIRVETFASAEEFLNRSIEGEPECIVLDVHLGEMTGFDLEAQLAAEGARTPIIFITGHDDLLPRLTRRPIPCGYLRKPFDASVLVSLLRPHLTSSSSSE